MELLTAEAAESWCEARHVFLRSDAIPSAQLALRGEMLQLRVTVPCEVLPCVALAYVVVMTGLVDDNEANFEGGLLWLVDWDFGSETTDRVGLKLLRSIRDTTTELLEKPGHLFGASDFVEANTIVSLPGLFQWDAFFIPESGSPLVFISHEGYVVLSCREQLEYKRLAARFGHGNWG